jgi:hypothetical protein
VNINSLIATHPRLFHMAEDGSWPSIQTHGLLSTSALLTKWEYPEKEKEAICCKHRPKNITIEHRVYGKAVIRDQKAIDPSRLRRCLVDMTEEEWYRLLNSKVFFWLDWTPLVWFLGAINYINKPHVVITVETRRLVGKYADKITLSAINTGSTYPRINQINPEPRGRDTLKPISQYQMASARELAVDNSVEDITQFAISVDRLLLRKKDTEPEKLATLWRPNDRQLHTSEDR